MCNLVLGDEARERRPEHGRSRRHARTRFKQEPRFARRDFAPTNQQAGPTAKAHIDGQKFHVGAERLTLLRRLHHHSLRLEVLKYRLLTAEDAKDPMPILLDFLRVLCALRGR
jgi:hypothetical protein